MKLKFILLLLVLSLPAFAQFKDDDAIAKVGDKVITVGEFKTRYQMRPMQNSMMTKDEERAKAKILYSIIAEKLWALEAENENYDTTDVMKYTYKSMEKSFLRDALYKKEIESKVKIKDIDYIRAVQKSKLNLEVKYLLAQSKQEAESLYKLLKNGASFDSLLLTRHEKDYQQKPIIVKFGDLPLYIEDSLYALEIGDYTNPILNGNEWYIYKLSNKDFVNELDERVASENQKKVRSILEARATNDVFQSFYKDFFKGRKIESNGYLFWTFADNVINVLDEIRKRDSLKANNKVVLEAKYLYKIADSIGPDSLNMTFINIENNKITLKEFLYDFVFEGFYTVSDNPDIIRAQLNARVKRFIELELLYMEAKKDGFYKNEQVQKDIAMWKPYYEATLLKDDFKRDIKITDDEVLQYYNEIYDSSKKVTMINIIEVLSDSLEVIENAMKIADDNAQFRSFAAAHTKREWVKKNKGEFGLFPSNAYGEIGRIAVGMNVGQTYGPIKLDDGYSFFKLIDKKENQELPPKSFNDLKDELRKQLMYKKSLNAMIDRTVNYAKKYGVDIKYDVLYNLDVKNLNMLVYRYMGFGGRILATPMTPIFSEWVEKWQHQKESL